MCRIALLPLLLIAACPADDNAGQDAGACNCALPTALLTTYDNASSMLGGDNVQDALDELAARPMAESPVLSRVDLIVGAPDNSGLALANFVVQCPMPDDRALGGSCGILNTGTLIGFDLGLQGISCNYSQTAGNTEKPSVRVMCLHRDQ